MPNRYAPQCPVCGQRGACETCRKVEQGWPLRSDLTDEQRAEALRIGRISFVSAGAVRKGNGLHPTQSLECSIRKLADGTMSVSEVRLSMGERAAKLNELARQAEASEQNYRLFNRVPRN